MHGPQTDEILREQKRRLDEVRRAFAGVRRGDGVSISEALAMDAYEPIQKLPQYRAADTYSQWTELDLPKLDGPGSALTYMDAIGFRFHLPAYMTIELSQAFTNARDNWNGFGAVFDKLCPSDPTEKDDHFQQQIALLDTPQRRCVARFLAFFAKHRIGMYGIGFEHEIARDALRRFWMKFLSLSELRDAGLHRAHL